MGELGDLIGAAFLIGAAMIPSPTEYFGETLFGKKLIKYRTMNLICMAAAGALVARYLIS
jgi:hypothetical protein